MEHICHNLVEQLVNAVLFKVVLSRLDLSSVLVGNSELLNNVVGHINNG